MWLFNWKLRETHFRTNVMYQKVQPIKTIDRKMEHIDQKCKVWMVENARDQKDTLIESVEMSPQPLTAYNPDIFFYDLPTNSEASHTGVLGKYHGQTN